MKSVHNIKNSVKRIDIKAGSEMHERVLCDLVQKMEASKRNEPVTAQLNMWRKIMNNRLIKIAAVFMILAGASITIAVLSNQTGERGVKFTVFFNKVAWTSDETPVLLWDLMNRAVGPLEDVDSYELEYDGSVYVDSQKNQNVKVFFTNADYRDYEYALDNRWINKQTGQELKITPGKHKVSLSFKAIIRDGSEERTVKIESNAAEFRVLEPCQEVSEEIELEAAVGGKPGKKYTAEQVAQMHYEKYGEKLSNEELAEFYLIHGMETKDIDALECTLAFKQSDIDTLKLYSTLSSAYHSQLLKYSDKLWSRQRKIEAIVCLRGLNYALGLDLGMVQTGGMSVCKYYDANEDIPVGQLPAIAITVAQDKNSVRALIEQRQSFISSLISMYGRKPDALDELHELFLKYLNDKDAADKFLEAIRINQDTEKYPGSLFFGRDYYIQSRNKKIEKVDSYQVYDANGLKLEGGFVPDKNEIILGENTYITFYVKNLGNKTFTFDIGGDYRGKNRPDSFGITAVDENGTAVEDPYASNMNFGGLGSGITINKGDIYIERLFIKSWCNFEKPGTYAVTCSRTLGSWNSSKVLIEVSFQLKITPPDQNKTKQLIEKLGEQIETGNAGQIREASQILSEINNPLVIPHLIKVMNSKVDWNAKNPAIDGLKQFSVIDTYKGFIGGLKDNDDVVRSHAVGAIAEINGKDFVAAALLKELESEDDSEKELTIRALGAIGGEKAFDVLKTTLENKDSKNNSNRYSAAEAIGSLCDANGIEVLEKYVEDKDFNLRLAAIRGIVSLKQPVQATWLVPVIKSTTNINDQNFHEAIRLLRLYGNEQAGPGLVSCLKFDDPLVKSQYNFFLILAIEACKDVPKHADKYHHDPNIDGSPEQIEENQKVLDFYKTWLESTGNKN